MPLHLYNSFTKREEEFVPLTPGHVSMYTCGPTVYGRPHIGNYSSFLLADLLRRWLEVGHGYEVKHVKNITDVGHLVADAQTGEDKIEKQAREEKLDPLAIAKKYTIHYLDDEKFLHFLTPHARPKATETIPEMIAIIATLVEKEYAYETADGVYFSVETFPAYGQLSGNTLDKLDAGSRVAVDENKRHPADFALWKKTVGANASHLLHWPSPWGEGFPGWHIECSAMSTKFLGETIDIHTGGEDNIFPHHECEIAQSECASGKQFVRFWLHRRRIDISLDDANEQKMSKSLGNVISIPDIMDHGFDPMDLRYLLLSVHYRTRLKFTWKGLDDARKARRKICEWIAEIEKRCLALPQDQDVTALPIHPELRTQRDAFVACMDNDLNVSGALATIFEVISWSRTHADCTSQDCAALFAFIQVFKYTFGCFDPLPPPSVVPPAVQALLDERATARKAKDFAASDRLRDEIKSLGYEVRDSGGEQVAKRL